MNTEKKPEISINICTHNRANLIKKSIESAQNQTFQNFEIIVADNGSDETESVIADLVKNDSRIKYFKNQTKGITENRNFALAKSAGDFVAVLDSDDYWILDTKLQMQIDFLKANPECAVVGNQTKIVNEDDIEIGKIINETDDFKIRQKILLKNQFVHSSVLFRKSFLENEKYQTEIWEDYDLILRLGRKHKLANLDILATAYKKHKGNVSNTKRWHNLLILGHILDKNSKYYPHHIKAKIKNYFRFFIN